MDKLRTYLESADLSRFAAAVGVDLSTASRWRGGSRVPSPEMAARIEAATLGLIVAADIRPDVFGEYVRRRGGGVRDVAVPE